MRLCASVLRCPSPNVCGSCRVCPKLRCSRRVCSRLCSFVCRSRRLCAGCRSDLLCTSSDLLQQWLQQLLQEVLLLQDAKAPLPQDPLLQSSQELLQLGLRSDLRRSSCLCSDLCRSGRLRTDLCCSGCLLPLNSADDDDRVT